MIAAEGERDRPGEVASAAAKSSSSFHGSLGFAAPPSRRARASRFATSPRTRRRAGEARRGTATSGFPVGVRPGRGREQGWASGGPRPTSGGSRANRNVTRRETRDRLARAWDDDAPGANATARGSGKGCAPAFSSMSFSAWKLMFAKADRDCARSRAGYAAAGSAPEPPVPEGEGDGFDPRARAPRAFGEASRVSAGGFAQQLMPTEDDISSRPAMCGACVGLAVRCARSCRSATRLGRLNGRKNASSGKARRQKTRAAKPMRRCEGRPRRRNHSAWRDGRRRGRGLARDRPAALPRRGGVHPRRGHPRVLRHQRQRGRRLGRVAGG